MKKTDLEFVHLKRRLEDEVNDGKPTHKKFLRWFLLYVLGIDETAADDAICDGPNDKGIDGIFVDDDNEDIIFMQSKVKERSKSKIGDKFIREFHGSYSHLNTSKTIKKFMEGTPNQDLAKLINDKKIGELIDRGYTVKSMFITNSELNTVGKEQVALHPEMQIFDGERIAEQYLGNDKVSGVTGKFEFSYDSDPLEYAANSKVNQIVIMAKATELVALPGIDSNKLFDLNVRNPLGNTKVNKGIRDSIKVKNEHRNFPLFHNGIVVVCNKMKVDSDADQLIINDIAVVNGAQSLKQLYLHKELLTDDLKVLTRFINAGLKSDLANKVTDRTNSQNGVKARDKRSNDLTQTALERQVKNLNLGYIYDIRRGSTLVSGDIISNQKAGQLLLAFDRKESYATHLINNIFDGKYVDIFNRNIVDGARIVALHELYKTVEDACEAMSNKALGSYAQTKYLLLKTLRDIFESEESSVDLYKDLGEIVKNGKVDGLKEIASVLLEDLVVDLEEIDADVANLDNFKSDLKNSRICEKISANLLKERKRLVKRGRADSLEDLVEEYL
ncbi:AIPR family protein [Litorimonas haliclonae]|uniref:AIPR family protein n=1 Tax=Litorimonas haliclonae TaxID=2081977 RepID=UPI0039EF64FE